jgi:nucleotide-binding universal stress UspA family protein
MNQEPTAPLRLLCATDFSAASRQAFHHALAIALTRPTELILLHVGPESRDKVPWDRFPEVRETLAAWGRLAPDADKQVVADDLGITVRKMAMRDENPALGILDHLDRHPADLIVMATQPPAGLARLRRQSVAGRLLRAGRSKMLLLPKGCRSLIDEATGEPQLRQLLLPLDHHPDPRDAIALAADWLTPLAPAGLLATTLFIGRGPAPQCVLPGGRGINWQQRRADGPVARTIIDQAATLDAGLVVMATAGRAGWREWLHGSTLERTLRWLGRPLLAIPSPP